MQDNFISCERILMRFLEGLGWPKTKKKLIGFSLFVDSGSYRNLYHYLIGRKLTLRCVRQVAAPFFWQTFETFSRF